MAHPLPWKRPSSSSKLHRADDDYSDLIGIGWNNSYGEHNESNIYYARTHALQYSNTK